jgi:squalene-hopene/tetraprenyl-beta-curcumene cyclase
MADRQIRHKFCISTLFLLAVISTTIDRATGDETTTLEASTKPPPISANEDLGDTFSFRRAVDYLDNAALDWQQRKQCVTCHTNGLYLASRSEIDPRGTAYESARNFSRKYLKRYVIDKEPSDGDWGAVQGIVSTTAFLAISDVKTEGKLDPITIKALDYVWAHQSEEGCWEEWLKCNWPPFEVDNHFGVTLVAYALGMAPNEYTQTPIAQEGMRKLRKYLNDHPTENLHQRAMLLLASTTNDGILVSDDQHEIVAELLAQQKPDGGWNLIEMGVWKRSDGKEQDVVSSDGYATGFTTYVLRTAGVDAGDPRIQKAIAWLKANQRISGRWYTRSPRRDGRHYISHAGTSYAVLALAACGESLDPQKATEER